MTGRISNIGQYNLDALSRRKSRSSIRYNNGSYTESDNADISSFGTLLAKVNAEMKNIPDVRNDIVTNFKAQVDAGTYNPPLEKLADRLYLMGMLDLTEE